jgi:hypothetical protein
MLFETSLHQGCYIMLCHVMSCRYKHELRSTNTSVTLVMNASRDEITSYSRYIHTVIDDVGCLNRWRGFTN